MKTENLRTGECPKCGQLYTDSPALSRIDNATLICPDCGVRESLEYLGLPRAEQDKILAVIHNHISNR